MERNSVRGSCLCGGVTFEIAGSLTPIQLCHARRCRKATGAAYSPEMLGPVDGMTWTAGTDLIAVYEAPVLHDPPAYRKSFCRICGSPLPTAIAGTPFVIVQAGVLDDDPSTRPFRHAFVADKACWHDIADSLPQFDGQPPGPDDSNP